MGKVWRGKWIWLSQRADMGHDPKRHEMVLFRRVFTVSEVKAELVVHITADSRYKLFCNGQPVSVGPCKGDQFTYYYETVDLSAYLRPGRNVLAAQVLHYKGGEPYQASTSGNASVWRSRAGGLLLDGELRQTHSSVPLHTDHYWKAWRDESVEWVDQMPFTAFLGGMERVEAVRRPQDWKLADADEAGWEPAVSFLSPSDPVYGQLRPWRLVPRDIPPLLSDKRAFRKVMAQHPPEPDFSLLLGEEALDANGRVLEIPAGHTWVVEVDAGELVTAYPNLTLTGGRGGEIRMLYAECYEQEPKADGTRCKSVRDNPHQAVLLGPSDCYLPAGSGTAQQPERLETFWFRTFRFIRFEIRAGAEPLCLHQVNFVETGYPLEVVGAFESSDPTLSPLWDISIRTLRRCMQETYVDCPFYEQLQYSMDTQLEALFTYQVSGDDRLARKAIYEFHSSRLPSGMLQSRYPSMPAQVIPGFSLYWIYMVHEHYWYFADRTLLRLVMPTVDGVLNWFGEQIGSDGLVGPCSPEYWSYVDWVQEWAAGKGVPPAAQTGPLTVYNQMYAEALRRAAELQEALGRTGAAGEYRHRAEQVKEALKLRCWSPERGLFRDGPRSETYSQHAQVWAVVSGTVQGREAEQLMETMLVDPNLPRVSYAMSFYLFRAMAQIGRYADTFPLWDIWRGMARLNLSTWAESPSHHRSDCHGWGAVPLYEFCAEMLGVRPGKPGYEEISIAPQPGPLQWARGTVATCKGPVRIQWEIGAQGMFDLYVRPPAGVPVRIKGPSGREWRFEQHDGSIRVADEMS